MTDVKVQSEKTSFAIPAILWFVLASKCRAVVNPEMKAAAPFCLPIFFRHCLSSLSSFL